jgi:hypothetical protein
VHTEDEKKVFDQTAGDKYFGVTIRFFWLAKVDRIRWGETWHAIVRTLTAYAYTRLFEVIVISLEDVRSSSNHL